MTEFTFEMSDVERLGATLDERCADLDERDRALLDAVFAWAGQAVGADASEVQGYAALPGGPTTGPLAQSFCDGGHNIEIMSFSWGASNPSSLGATGGGGGAGKVSLSDFDIK